MNDDKENDLRKYLPSRELVQELMDERAAQERIKRAVENENVTAAQQPSERPAPGTNDAPVGTHPARGYRVERNDAGDVRVEEIDLVTKEVLSVEEGPITGSGPEVDLRRLGAVALGRSLAPRVKMESGVVPIRPAWAMKPDEPTKPDAPVDAGAPVRAGVPVRAPALTSASVPTGAGVPVRASVPTSGAPKDPAAVAVGPRSAPRGRRPMNNVVVTLLAVIGVLAPVTLALVLWPRASGGDPNASGRDTTNGTAMASTTAGNGTAPNATGALSATSAVSATATTTEVPDAASTVHAPVMSAPPGSGKVVPKGSGDPYGEEPGSKTPVPAVGTGTSTASAPTATPVPSATPAPTSKTPMNPWDVVFEKKKESGS